MKKTPPSVPCGIALLLVLAGLGSPVSANVSAAQRDLKKLTLEELVNTEFTSLAKKPQRRFEAPAAVSIIRGEEILRSGARSIPEALRMAPGVHVARQDANKWAIGIRGFTSRLARSQLALMDGRSHYTPLFAGVYWEVQDTLLEDIEQIEVIRGPGGSLWGANAVNGIVNILTKSARDTQGVVAKGGGGTEERGFGAARYGGKIGRTWYRVYGKYFERDAGFSRDVPDFDDWRMGRAGFRTDTDLENGDLLTVQGDIYDGEAGQRTSLTSLDPPAVTLIERDNALEGANLLGRWTHALGEGFLTVQSYYDRTYRREPTFREERNTFDLDAQHRFPLGRRQEVQWGLGYRLSADDTGSVSTVAFVPENRELHLFSGFLQDDIEIVPERLRLILGSKFEHNDYSGFEIQPSGRVLWTPAERHALWASVSRAVRTPSRIEDDLVLVALLDPQTPTFAELVSDGRFDPEEIIAYEAGYRVEVIERVFLDLAGFYNRYDDLLSIEPGPPFFESDPPPGRAVVPFFFRNRVEGDVYGVEVSAEVRILDDWTLRADYSYLQIDLEEEPGSQDPNTVTNTEGASPHHQVSVRSIVDLPRDLAFDVWLRYVDNLPAQNVGAYVTTDVRVAWQPTDGLEVAAVGQNLVESHHAEFGGGAAGTVEVERGAYGEVTWRW